VLCEHAEESSLGHAEAMFEIADAVTQCKFEASDKDTDEVVLYKILQVASAPSNCYTTPVAAAANQLAAEQYLVARRPIQRTHVPVTAKVFDARAPAVIMPIWRRCWWRACGVRWASC